MVTCPETDASLTLRARARATGSNVHTVNNLCSLYEASVRLCRAHPRTKRWSRVASMSGEVLRTFVLTGNLPPDAVQQLLETGRN